MQRLLKWEEAAQFVLGVVLFSTFDYPWWWFPACLLLPDLSMLGYAVNPKTGAWTYNFFHHKLLAVGCYTIGLLWRLEWLAMCGTILLAHSAMDRVFGYGLKYADDFRHTHLGRIGKREKR